MMGGLPGHHPLHQARVRIGRQPDRLAQHRRSQLPPVRRRQRNHQAGDPRIRWPGQPHQRPRPDHPRIILLTFCAQDLQRPLRLAGVQRAARPRQHHRLRRRPRPLQDSLGHRVHRVHRLRRRGARAQLAQPARGRDREHFGERRRPLGDPFHARRGQVRQQLGGQLCPGRIVHGWIRLGPVHPAGQIPPRLTSQHTGPGHCPPRPPRPPAPAHPGGPPGRGSAPPPDPHPGSRRRR